ncbi:rRNA-processing protein utp23 [Pseudocercospora fuligena]|uniref:U three protein 23 n=1 Tax=Pseudocercospora fuligena TaxID=685502 RepID=A0A8H6RW46_9PEZI|nr:rRNA-processing protein utp23 [Pseudocercospora fuligena]
MKGKRSKQYRKLMQQYQLNFNFREPYQVILDADIIKDAARFKMQLGKMLQNTLHGEIKPMITQCCIRHLYNEPASSENDAWISVAKDAERRRCGHHELEEPLSALECIESVVDPKGTGNNKHRYVVAVQDDEVRRKMRKVVGVPLVYIARSVMILEPMADATQEVREKDEKAKIRAGLKGRRPTSTGEKRKRDDDEDDDDEKENESLEAPKPKKYKVKGPKGPNPLSVKKSKKDNAKDKQQGDGQRTAVRKFRQESRAGDQPAVPSEGGEGAGAEGQKKRKRKRKPKEPKVAAADEHGSGSED